MNVEHRYTAQLGRSVMLRDNNSDDGMWEEAFGRGLHLPPPEMPYPKLVLDLGANIGLTAASYQVTWPEAEVWMVEPNPENMALARKNAPFCPPLECAVAKESGWRGLRERGLTPSAYSLGDNGRLVYALGLVELVKIMGGEVDFCKMDVEGEEWEILDSPLIGVRHLLVEFHGSDYGHALEKGLRLLSERGWDAHHHTPHPAAVYATR